MTELLLVAGSMLGLGCILGMWGLAALNEWRERDTDRYWGGRRR